MKKFIAGIVVGALLFGAVPVFAETIKSIVGAKVTGVYSIEQGGKKIAEGAIINGAAYVPVRKIAEATGVGITVEGKVITLEETSTPTATKPLEGDALSEEAVNFVNQISKLEREILNVKLNITAEKVNTENIENAIATEKARTEKIPGIIESLETNLAKSRATIADYEAKITLARKQIAEIQAKIDALNK